MSYAATEARGSAGVGVTYAGLLSNTRAEAATLPEAERICASPSAKASACKHPPLCTAVAAAVTCAQNYEKAGKSARTKKQDLSGGSNTKHNLCFNSFVHIVQRQKGGYEGQGRFAVRGSGGRRGSEMSQQQATSCGGVAGGGA